MLAVLVVQAEVMVEPTVEILFLAQLLLLVAVAVAHTKGGQAVVVQVAVATTQAAQVVEPQIKVMLVVITGQQVLVLAVVEQVLLAATQIVLRALAAAVVKV